MLRRSLFAVVNFELRCSLQLNSTRRLGTNDTPLKKIEEKFEDLKVTILGDKYKSKRQREAEEKNKRQGPFKYYYEQDERDKGKIMKNEQYFDDHCKERNRENFMSAIEAYKQTNPAKNLYIDFVYGALLKMKEYNAHTHLEAYRKLMELFPVGPLRADNLWQRDNFHYPRQQTCAIAILEQMERNGVILDEEFAVLVVSVFGDWTHAVRKAKRQLYWLPKFRNLNPYPVPSIAELETMSQLDLAVRALKRITKVDPETKISTIYTKEIETDKEDTWIVSAQSSEQRELLKNHNPSLPIFIDGPYSVWMRSKTVEYFIMRTDPLDEYKLKMKRLGEYDEGDIRSLKNIFSDPFKPDEIKKQKPELSVHEQADGTIYALCATGTGTKNSILTWTKLLEMTNPDLKAQTIIYRVKDKPSHLTTTSEKK